MFITRYNACRAAADADADVAVVPVVPGAAGEVVSVS